MAYQKKSSSMTFSDAQRVSR